MNTNIKMTVTEAVNFRLNVEMIANLKRLARHVSYHLDDDYTYVDIIRCLLADQFAIPETDAEAEAQLKVAQDLCARITTQAALAGVLEIPDVFTTGTISTATVTYSTTPKPKKSKDSGDDAANTPE